MKEMEKFQKSGLLWVFGSKLQHEQQLKSYNILPVCYQFELLTFTMASKMFSGRYLYDFATHIDFRVHDRTLRTQAMSLITYNYHSLAHQKSFFSRAAEMINFLYRHKVITGLDTMNIQAVRKNLMLKNFCSDLVCSHYICCACNSCKFNRIVIWNFVFSEWEISLFFSLSILRASAALAVVQDTGQLAGRQLAENWLRDNLPINFRLIVLHVRQIGFWQNVFRQIVPYPFFAPAKRLK